MMYDLHEGVDFVDSRLLSNLQNRIRSTTERRGGCQIVPQNKKSKVYIYILHLKTFYK